jgi:L-iditol 2-dehydrogenase
VRCSQVVGPGKSEVVTVRDPEPGPGQVLVKVEASGVCASDLEAWRSHNGVEPRRLGHEVTGSIVAVGTQVYGWAAGERVTGLGSPGYAELLVMDAASILPVPDGVPSEVALGEPLACQAETFLRTPSVNGARFGVVGLGYMGLGFLQLARQSGPSAIIGVDLTETGRKVALSLGASEVYHPEALPEGYRSSSNVTLALDPRCGVVLEATGSAGGLALAGEMVAPDGVLVILGYHASGPRQLDLSLWYKGVTIINGFTGNRVRRMHAMAWGLGLIRERTISYAPMITHRFGLEDVDAAFNLFDERPTGFVKAVIHP